MKTVHLIIRGKVQGVYFRASAQKEAERLGLTGWVQNITEGVEAVASGEEGAVSRFVAWCHKGPARASVQGVTLEEVPYTSFDRFSIRR
ncbi:MAG: acylphosphatase [Chitinophagaceae bacterium]|nr:acylphosphatase [Chitinophagaceae bacterium]MCZ2395416.1 acylphosphatase [Chitinophagales bacterium]